MKYTELIKQAAKTHYDKTPGHPADQVFNTNYYAEYFSPFGAGSKANEILINRYDRKIDALTSATDDLDFFARERRFDPDVAKEYSALTDKIKPLLSARRNHLWTLRDDVDNANKKGIGIGALAGLAGGGLTYAGLGLIPKLKKEAGFTCCRCVVGWHSYWISDRKSWE